jgi:predicted nucleic acid-binding protein
LSDPLVVDASAILQGCYSDSGLHVFDGFALSAPGHFHAEVLSVLHEQAWRSEVSAELATLARRRLLATDVAVYPSRELADDACAIADALGWAKTYDAEYLALAQRLGCRLVTIDAKLRRSAARLVEIVAPADL